MLPGRARWIAALFASLAVGCSCGVDHERSDGDATIAPLDADVPDRVAPPDRGLDGPLVDSPLGDAGQGCGDRSGSGLHGDHCRSGTCETGSDCIAGSCQTIQMALGLRTGSATSAAHPGYAMADPVDDLTSEAPYQAAARSLCAQMCDYDSGVDTCGATSTCSQVSTQAPIVASLGGALLLFGARGMHGASSGVCRTDCTWSGAARSPECPDDAFACDTLGNVCVDACVSDLECNTGFGVTYEGEIVTVIESAHPAHCDSLTGRCRYHGMPGATVGASCTSGDDCAPGTGICLDGGHCAEIGCDDPSMPTSVCGPGGSGVCLFTSATTHPTGICVTGCTTPSDCPTGNACQQFGMGLSIGPHTGYCIGVCANDSDCHAGEGCNVTVLESVGPTALSHCVPVCTSVGAIGSASGCPSGQACIANAAPSTLASCRALDAFCGAPKTFMLAASSPECATGFVCDELLAGSVVADGHCAPACTSPADCAAGTLCIPSGRYAGLCRSACASDASCGAGQVCDPTAGWCIEAAAPS